LRDGPGIKELESLLDLIQSGLPRWTAPLRYLPTLSVCVNEGAFGAGPDSSLDWANRLDVGVQARWNLTEWLTAATRSDSRTASSGGRVVLRTCAATDGRREGSAGGDRERPEQLRHGRETIEHGRQGVRIDKKRLEQGAGASCGVLQAVRGLELAHLNYISGVTPTTRRRCGVVAAGQAGRRRRCKAGG